MNGNDILCTDSPLSSKGKEQCKYLAQRFESVPVDQIITSHLVRAKEIAESIARVIHKPIEVINYLYERRRPSSTEGLHKKDPKSLAYEQKFDELYDYDGPIDRDGESYMSLTKRAKLCIDLIRNVQQNTIIISHGGLMLATLYEVMTDTTCPIHMWRKLLKTIRLDNTSVTKIEVMDKKMRIHYLGDVSHLT